MSEHNPRAFIDMNGGYQSHREGADKLAHDAWVKSTTWGLTRDDFIRLSYFHGDLESGSDGLGPVNGSEDRPHDAVYIGANGCVLSRSMVSHWLADCNSFMHGYKTAVENAATQPPQDERGQRLSDAQATLETIANILGTGSEARKNHVTLVHCIENAMRRSACLSRIEQEFFMVERPPVDWDEDDEGGEGGEECLLNWGQSPDEYEKQFGEALKKILLAQPVALSTLTDERISEIIDAQFGRDCTTNQYRAYTTFARAVLAAVQHAEEKS